jgi:phosphoribosylglycinamide formyltransferase-1
MKRIAVFVSGGGTDFQSLIDGVKDGRIDARIALCVASKPGIFALERAKANDIPYEVFCKRDFPTAKEMFLRISERLDALNIDLIVLAGYMTILEPEFVRKYKGRIINIHPSLIPKYCGEGYYGMRVHDAVIAAGEKTSGATVHYVDEGVDTGEIIMQREVPVLEGDTAETLAARVLEAEHSLLPEVVAMLCKKNK